MTIHDAILEALTDCPTARDLIASAHHHALQNDGPGVAIHVSLAADVLVHNHPELGDAREVARVLADGVFAIPRQTERADLLN
jgi:hypothetical protein